MSNDDILFTPHQLGDLTLNNRVVLAPMTRGRSGDDRIPNDVMNEYYTQRSSAGLLITEGTTISEQANGWVENAGIYTDAMAEGWKPIVESVQANGAKFYLQLWHCGRASHNDFQPDGALPVAASPIKIEGSEAHTPSGKKPYPTPQAMTLDGIARTVNDFRKAAEFSKQAGFDGVEIHAANGYLIDTFLQSKTNHRDDQYGGSIENRFRILAEIVEAVATVYPLDRIGVRQSPNGNYNDMGSPDYREQFSYNAKELDKLGIGYIHVIDGLGFGFHELGKPMTLAEYRKLFSRTLIGNCSYTKESASEQINDGNADLVAFGRAFYQQS